MSSTSAAAAVAALRFRLALDLRSLALLRAGLGAVLLIDALLRLCSASLLYADSGLLPRAVAAGWIEPARLSLHLANGSAMFALALTLLQVLAAAALLAGWRTRVAALLCWLLAVSAAARNPLVVTAGDALAIALLTWGLFLPLAARWSLDAAGARDQDDSPSQFSLAGAVLLAQTLCLFLFAAIALPAGSVGLGALPLLDAARPALDSALWWALLLITPLALLSLVGGRPGLIARRLALGLMLLFCGIAILATEAGSLPWLGLCAAAIWIDSALWERLASQDDRPGLRVFHAETDSRTARLALLLREMLCLPSTTVAPAAESPRAARLMQPGKTLVVFDRDDTAHLDGAALRVMLLRSPLLRLLRTPCAGASALALCERLLPALLRCMPSTNPQPRSLAPTLGAGRRMQGLAVLLGICVALAQLGPREDAAPGASRALYAALRAALMPLGLDHDWTWRARPEDSAWMAVPGELREGREVDARSATLAAPQFGRDQERLLAGSRGTLYEQRLLLPGASAARLALAQHLCAQRGDALARLRVVQMLPSPGAASAPAEQRVLLRLDCP